MVLVVLEEPKGGRMDVKPRSEMHWMRGRLAAMKLPLGTGASVISQGSWPPRPEELECGRSPIRTPFLLTSYGRSPLRARLEAAAKVCAKKTWKRCG